MKRTMTLLAGFFLFVTCFSPVTLWAAPYFEGKKIVYTVGSEPGGGYDRMARLYSKYLPKYIPGKPPVIVSNMPGASGMVCANYVYNIAKPDGQTIGAFHKASPFAQLLKAEGVRFDLRKFSWIGSTAVEATVLVIRKDLPYKTLAEIVKTKPEVMLGGTGPAELGTALAMLLNDFLGLNLKMVTYNSGSAAMLAVERKEVDGRAASFSSMKPYIDRGLVQGIARGRISEPEIDALPTVEDFTTDPKGKTFMAILSSPDRVGRPTVLPPGTPADITKTIRDAFLKVNQDPEFREDAKRSGGSTQLVPGEECLNLMNFILNQPPEVAKEIGRYIKF